MGGGLRVELKGLAVRVLRFFRENPGALPVVGFSVFAFGLCFFVSVWCG